MSLRFTIAGLSEGKKEQITTAQEIEIGRRRASRSWQSHFAMRNSS